MAAAVYCRAVRIAVVTGGSSGIGAALARALTAAGWRCILVARGRERLERTAEELGAEAELCDVGDRAEVERAAARVAERHGAIHLLVNNAGIRAGAGFVDLAPERIEEVVRTNYLGSVWCTRAFLPLLEAGVPARIVNLVSIAGLVTRGAFGPYAASKHAQLAFSRALAGELAPRGVKVLTVCPGPVETPGFPQDELLQRPLARRAVLQAEEVAAAVLKALDDGRGEIVLPGYLRTAALVEAAAPSVFGRIVSRATGRGEAPRGREQRRR
jgi:NAD(P)-dependent dehydrogenase (short-subunit alcohol dehydrogenase family)